MSNLPSQENTLWKFLFYACTEKLQFPVFFCDGKFPLSSRIIWLNDYALNFFSIPRESLAQKVFLNNYLDIPPQDQTISDGIKVNCVTVIKKKYYNVVATVNFYGEYHVVELMIDTHEDLDYFYRVTDAINFYPLGKIVWNHVTGQIIKYSNSFTNFFDEVTHPAYISSFLTEPEVSVLHAKINAPKQSNQALYHRCLFSSVKQSLTCVGRFNKAGPYIYADIVVIESGMLSFKGLIKACSIIPGILALIEYEPELSRYSFSYANPRFIHTFLKSSLKEIKNQLPTTFFAQFNDEKIIPFLDTLINESDNYQSSVVVQFSIKDKAIKFSAQVTKIIISDRILFVLSLVELPSTSKNDTIKNVLHKIVSNMQGDSQKLIIKVFAGTVILIVAYLIFGVELKPIILEIIKIIFN